MRTPEQLKSLSLITAIKTPYLENGDIDFDTYDLLVANQIDAGVEGIVVGGTTGEGHLLGKDELLQLIAHSVERFSPQLAIIGNTGGNNTREAVKTTRGGFARGMDAALQVNPYYGKTSDAGLIAHFNAVLDEGPAFIYNVPGRTGQDLLPAIIEPLAKHKHFVGMKECAGNERIAYYEKQGIACWSGNDDQCHDARHEYAAHGVISVAANLVPGLMRNLMEKRSPELNKSMQPLFDWLFCEPNPIAINTALMMTGAVKPVFRLPYVPLSEAQQNEGVRVMQITGSENLIGGTIRPVALDECSLIGN